MEEQDGWKVFSVTGPMNFFLSSDCRCSGVCIWRVTGESPTFVVQSAK